MRRLTVGLAAALVLACGGAQADGTKLLITKAVWDGFQQYRGWVTSIGSGYYAVTTDGVGGASAGCPSNNCQSGPSLKSAAIAACEKGSPGRTCVIFAKNQDPVIDYEIAP
jgi:hypothetical protein